MSTLPTVDHIRVFSQAPVHSGIGSKLTATLSWIRGRGGRPLPRSPPHLSVTSDYGTGAAEGRWGTGGQIGSRFLLLKLGKTGGSFPVVGFTLVLIVIPASYILLCFINKYYR